jgi:hypothetical protein
VKTLQETGIGKDFLNRTPVVCKIRARIDKWDGDTGLKSKGNNYPTEETMEIMVENLCQLFS